jgi:hypothetical protein
VTGIMPIGIYVGLFVRMMLAFIVDITRGNDTEVAEHATAALCRFIHLACADYCGFLLRNVRRVCLGRRVP